LLLADDSAAVQKVIELTFADEGMEVVSVGDGLLALAELEHITPDVILADAFMPGLNGYELCRSIKDDKRFAQIPVMLLVSSFAPFDEAAAHRAGADDIMTKPFQSIRQLVNRVGSLLAANNDDAPPRDTSTLGLAATESPMPSVAISEEPDNQSNVTVMVEAAQLELDQTHEASGSACAPDIESQTADTAKLERVFDEPEPDESAETWQVEDTIEIEPVLIDAEIDVTPIEAAQVAPTVAESDESPMNQIHNQPRPNFDGALLDLDESDFSAASIADDVVLDLDFEESAPGRVEAGSARQTTPIEEPLPAPIQPVTTHEVMSATAVPEPAIAIDEVVNATMHQDQAPALSTAEPLSAQQIDAIARRVMDQMSDKVVREIVWEVVPELSELLIKKKLAEQK